MLVAEASQPSSRIAARCSLGFAFTKSKTGFTRFEMSEIDWHLLEWVIPVAAVAELSLIVVVEVYFERFEFGAGEKTC